jgi:hypothetical protein
LDLVAFATATATAPPAVTPLAAVVDGGRLVIGWFDGRDAALAGADFARLVAASLDDLRPEVRLAVAWPKSPDACLELDHELAQMARALDRVLWVPPRGGSAIVVPDLTEPVAVDTDSRRAPWLRYDPDESRGSTLFAGADGRLLSASEDKPPTAAVMAGSAVETTGAVTAFARGSALVAEWEGEEFEDAGRADALDELRDDHSSLIRRADDAFRRLDFARPDEVRWLEGLTTAWSAYLDAYGRRPDTMASTAELHRVFALRRMVNRVLDACGASATAEARPAAPPRPAPTPDAQSRAPVPWPAVLAESAECRVSATRPAHHISWLPAHPLVNASDMELYEWSGAVPELEGVTAPDVFLLCRPNPMRVAVRPQTRFLVRLSVGAQRAVRLAEYAAELPASIQHRARNADIYLLPTSWLAEVTALECYELDDAGEPVQVRSLSSSPLRVSFAGADHGVPGLPNAAVRWPLHRARVSGHVVLPVDVDEAKAALSSLPGWIPLHAKRPTADAGCAVYEIQVPRRGAVDIRRTMAMLSDMPVVASSLTGLGEHQLALPSRAFKRAMITRVHLARQGSPVGRTCAGRSLHDLVAG